MRIAVDAWELGTRPTGVGRYLRALLAEWQRSDNARPHRFVMIGPPGCSRGDAVTPVGSPQFEWRSVGRAGSGRTCWEQWDLPRALRREAADVLFAPAYSAPLIGRAPVVLTVHDVSFAAHPEWFHPRERWRRYWLTRLAARRAHTVVTESRYSAAEITRHLGIDPARIAVVPSGVPCLSSIWSGAEGVGSAGGERPAGREPLVLYVGSVFNRRRVPDLIRAFARAASSRPAARLDVVGENRTHPHENLELVAAASGVSGRVALRAYVSDEELSDLYKRASVFAFLSEYEGFGFTPLEALANGTPIVVLDTPVAREIYRDAALYVSRDDLDGTASAIGRLLDDPDLRDDLLARGASVLAGYSWTSAAERTLDILLAAARSGRRPGA